MFIDQAVRTPQRIALTDEQGQMTYQELLQWSYALCQLLENKDVAVEELVLLRLPKGRWQVIAALGVMMSGGAYLPVEVSWPSNRCETVARKGQCRLALISSDDDAISAVESVHVPNLQPVAMTPAEIAKRFVNQQTPENLAYVIFTSGSTGEPKGVAIEHHAAVNTLLDVNHRYGVTAQDKVLCVSALSFDLSVYDIFGLLAVGGEMVFPREAQKSDPAHWLEMVQAHEITLWDTVPLSAQLLIEQLPDEQVACSAPIRNILMSGDWIPPSLPSRLKRVFPQADIYSMGGATEGSIWSINYPITRDFTHEKSIPYGRALTHQAFYILNEHMNPVPKGVIGELYIGGVGVAREYFGDAALSARKFVRHDAFGKIYRTGDLGRYLPDDNIEFIGRADDQVKVRGFRIELGEIEFAITSLDSVANSIVITTRDSVGQAQLVGYLLPHDGVEADNQWLGSVKTQLRHLLPEYMVPSLLIPLQSIPLTANGKVDKSRLPAPDLTMLGQQYVPPQTETERSLVAIWAQLLKQEEAHISTSANFFELGGHSLLLVRLVSEIEARGWQVSAQQVFRTNTLAELAHTLDAQDDSGIKASFAPPHYTLAPDCEQITPDMLPLAQLTEADLAHIAATVPGGVANIQDIYPLMPLQEGILFHHMHSPEDDPYVMQHLVEIDAETTFERFMQGLAFIVSRHDVLRTGFVYQGVSQIVQVVQRSVEIPVEYVAVGEGEDALAVLKASALPTLSVSQAPLLAVTVAVCPQSQQHYARLCWHHLTNDHVGLEIVQHELMAFMGEGEDALRQPVAFREAVAWAQHQQAHLDADTFFTQMLGEVTEPTLPYGLGNTNQGADDNTDVFWSLSGEQAERIRAWSRSQQLSPAAFFHAAWAMVIGACAQQDEVVFGTVMSGRLQGATGQSDMIGMFINTLPLKVDLCGDAKATISDIAGSLRALTDFEYVSLSSAKQHSQVNKEAALFSAILNYRHTFIDDGVHTEEQGSIVTLDVKEYTNYPFCLSVDDYGVNDGFKLSLQVDKSIDKAHMQSFVITAMEKLLMKLEAAESDPVSEICVLPDSQVQFLTSLVNDAAVDYKNDLCLYELFECQAERHPDKIALICEENQLTYGELNCQANRVADYLQKVHQVGPDVMVGLCVERSLEMVIGILGILKAGGAYVPLDPGYPQVRLSYMIADAELSVVLCNKAADVKLDSYQGETVLLDGLAKESESTAFANYSSNNIPRIQTGLSADHIAYVIFTSGTTGQPKGVMVEHKSVVNLAHGLKDLELISEGQTWGWVASLAFDASLQGLCQLCSGTPLVVISEEKKFAINEMRDLIKRENIGALDCTPSLLATWMTSGHEDGMPNLLIGGEAINNELWKQLVVWQQQTGNKAFNVYGPTECTVDATWTKIEGDVPVIGRMMPNYQGYVLDRNAELLPQGVIGELYVGGYGLARGYHKQPDLTSAKFIEHQFGRLYKTGDLVRILPDGNMEFVGRTDEQVKIRGHRIELDEVNYQISQCDSIENAVSLTRDGVLVSYAVGNREPSEVISELANRLPSYMVPSTMVMLDAFPLNSSGKIDKQALPAPDFGQLSEEHVSPVTLTEQQLADIWSRLLKLEVNKISRSANFFELGGHSLLAVKLLNEVQRQFNFELAVRDVFESRHLEALARIIDTSGQKVTLPAIAPLLREQKFKETEYNLSFSQQRLWFIDQLQEGSAEYNIPMAYEIEGKFNVSLAEKAISIIIERHEVLRTVYRESDSGSVQVIQPAEAFKFSHFDFTGVVNSDDRVKMLMTDEVKKAFDLTEDLMLRGSVVELPSLSGKPRYAVIFTMHHIASDGWSMGVLVKEFVSLYRGLLSGKSTDEVLTPLPIQYVDYAHWQRRYLSGETLSEQFSYWQKQLQDIPVLHGLLPDHTRPPVKSFIGQRHRSKYSVALQSGLQALGRAHGLTMFMVLQGAFALLLSRHTNSHDIVMGTPVANRRQAELNELIGFFVNTLVLRTNTNHEDVASFLAHVRQVHLDGQSNQDVPFEQVVEQCDVTRSTSYTPLFQIMFSMDTNELSSLSMPDISMSMQQSEAVACKFDIELHAQETQEGLEFLWLYDKALFTPERIAQLDSHLGNLLEALALMGDKSPESLSNQQLAWLPMLSDKEVHHLTVELNDTAVEYPKEVLIHELFEQQVEKTPDNVALVYEGSELTYKQLNARANQLAHYLQEQGVGPNVLVGLCMQRSLEMVIGILGIIKAGGAYVPLDPTYPQARLAYLRKDANLSTVLTDQSASASLGEFAQEEGGQCVLLDGFASPDSPLFAQYAAHNISRETSGQLADDLSHIIYTSGSTGQPKGVMVEHRNTTAMLYWAKRAFSDDELRRVLASTSLNFDLSVFELFVPLSFGYTSVVVDNATRLLEQRVDISLLNTVPSAAKVLAEQDAIPDSVRTINLAGERLTSDLVNLLHRTSSASTLR